MNTSYDEETYAYRIHAGYNSDNYSSDDHSDFDEVYEKNKPPPVLIDHSIYHVIKIEAFQEIVSKKNHRYGLYKNSLSTLEGYANKKPEVPLQIQQWKDNVNGITSSIKNNLIPKNTFGNEQSFLVHFLDSNNQYRESEKVPIKTVNESSKSSDKLENNQKQTKARANDETTLLKHGKKFSQYEDQRSRFYVSGSLLNNQKANSIIDNQERSEAKPVYNLVRNKLNIKSHSNLSNLDSKKKSSIASERDRKPFLSWIADLYQTENLNTSTLHHNILDDISEKATETHFSARDFVPKSVYSTQEVLYTNRLETPINNAWRIPTRCCANTRISRRINICKTQRNKYIVKRIFHEDYEIKRTVAMLLLGLILLFIVVICCNYLKFL